MIVFRAGGYTEEEKLRRKITEQEAQIDYWNIKYETLLKMLKESKTN